MLGHLSFRNCFATVDYMTSVFLFQNTFFYFLCFDEIQKECSKKMGFADDDFHMGFDDDDFHRTCQILVREYSGLLD